jgi:hypothetical protein
VIQKAMALNPTKAIDHLRLYLLLLYIHLFAEW